MRRSPTSAPRDVALDLVRGFCIVSMVLAHLAPGHPLTSLWHKIPNFDGLSGFVLLSGLVLGIVQRRRLQRAGLATVLRHGRGRLGLIVMAHVALMVVTFAVCLVGGDRMAEPIDSRSLAASELARAVVEGSLIPFEASVLRLYVLLLAAVLLVYWALERGASLVVAVCSIGLALTRSGGRCRSSPRHSDQSSMSRRPPTRPGCK